MSIPLSPYQIGVLLAILSGFTFTAMSLWARTLQQREGMVRYFCYFNMAPAAMALITWAVIWPDLNWPLIRAMLLASAPGLLGILFFGLALRHGEVSHVAPVMGGKTLIVTVMAVSLGFESAGPELWAASAVLFVALVLLSGRTDILRKPWRLAQPSLLLIVLACAGYGAADVITRQQIETHHLKVWDFLTVGWVMRGTVATIFLLVYTRVTRTAFWPRRTSTLLITAPAVAAHAILFVTAMKLMNSAIMTNVLSSLRGLIAVAAVWILGHLNVGRYERLTRRMIVWRLAGSVLVCLAVWIALSGANTTQATPIDLDLNPTPPPTIITTPDTAPTDAPAPDDVAP